MMMAHAQQLSALGIPQISGQDRVHALRDHVNPLHYVGASCTKGPKQSKYFSYDDRSALSNLNNPAASRLSCMIVKIDVFPHV